MLHTSATVQGFAEVTLFFIFFGGATVFICCFILLGSTKRLQEEIEFLDHERDLRYEDMDARWAREEELRNRELELNKAVIQLDILKSLKGGK